MKIHGPGGPAPTPTPSETPAPTAPKGPSFADALGEVAKPGGPGGPGGPSGPGGPGGPGGVDPARLDAIAHELRAGTITPTEAVTRITDAVMDGPGKHLPPSAREVVRAELTELVASDPHLTGIARRLGIKPSTD